MIENSKIKAAEKCLIDNGIEADEASTVLQAIGYILLDMELYPDNAREGKMMVYHNAECGNTGIIEEVNTYPYTGASKRQKGYRVMIKADYDNDFIYHVSVFETLEEAKNDLRRCNFEV